VIHLGYFVGIFLKQTFKCNVNHVQLKARVDHPFEEVRGRVAGHGLEGVEDGPVAGTSADVAVENVFHFFHRRIRFLLHQTGNLNGLFKSMISVKIVVTFAHLFSFISSIQHNSFLSD